jgi:Rps23 Pro-64 3,4-dihydroxylase Tpa1-like proline 4-hydroxylase
MSTHQRFVSKITRPLNTQILSGFLNHYKADDVRKTHLFDGRYENIYLTQQHIPELALLISEATNLAQQVSNVQPLRAGYWFNYMPPGSSTTLHTHDDDDELLSGVYYVHVPENSGNLIIYDNTQDNIASKTEIIPRAGEFIFFAPDTRHEVTENLSSEHRLSIGMNFGCPDTD